MSRVNKPRNKWMNTNIYPHNVTNVKVYPIEEHDYRHAKTLTDWLRLKYGIKYSTYKKKSKERRYQLCCEFKIDTGLGGPISIIGGLK